MSIVLIFLFLHFLSLSNGKICLLTLILESQHYIFSSFVDDLFQSCFFFYQFTYCASVPDSDSSFYCFQSFIYYFHVRNGKVKNKSGSSTPLRTLESTFDNEFCAWDFVYVSTKWNSYTHLLEV